MYSKIFITLLVVVFAAHAPSAADDAIDTQAEKTAGTVTGTVYDLEDGMPLAGVNILIEKTTLGAATDVNGKYIVTNIPAGSYTLAVSFIGYKSQTRSISVTAGEKLAADFRLQTGILEAGAIVVTGTSTPYLYGKAPVKTEVISRKLIDQTQSCNLAEALSLQTGVRVENNCQNCNFTQVRILGFDGPYTQVLVDGDPVVSSLAGVYVLEHFPDEMIGQIEVVKGGGSALYGGNAMAGTINLRTRQPAYNRSSISYNMESAGGMLDHRAGVVSEIVSDDGKSGAFIFGSVRGRSHYDHNNDGFSELGMLQNESIGANMFYRPLSDHELQISLHRIREDRRGGNDFDRPEHEADIAESTLHSRWGGKVRWIQRINSQWDYQTFYSFSYLGRDSYYGGLPGTTTQDSLEALNFYGNAQNRTSVVGLQSTYILGTHKFTFGGQYYSDMLKDNSVKDIRYRIDKTNSNSGVFLQDDVKMFNDKMNIIAGVRLDNHSAIADPVISPRLNARYELSGDMSLRAGLTTGFRAPQTFDEDLHIESLAGEQRVVRNVADLRPEQIRSITAGAEFEGFVGEQAVLVGLTGFYSALSDAFAEVESPLQSEDLVLWDRVNSDGATVYGVEADFGYKPVSTTELRMGITWKQASFDSPQEIFEGVSRKEFMRTPDLFGYFRASYDLSQELNIFSAFRFTGVMYVPDEAARRIVKTADTFSEIDAGLTWKIRIMESVETELAFGVKNLTNAYQKDLQKGVERDTGYVYGPQLPRRVYLGLDFAL